MSTAHRGYHDGPTDGPHQSTGPSAAALNASVPPLDTKVISTVLFFWEYGAFKGALP